MHKKFSHRRREVVRQKIEADLHKEFFNPHSTLVEGIFNALGILSMVGIAYVILEQFL